MIIVGQKLDVELEVLEQFNKAGYLGVPIGSENPDPEKEKALMKGLQNFEIALLDIRPGPVQTPQGVAMVPCRIFGLSDKGRARLNELRERKRIDGLTK